MQNMEDILCLHLGKAKIGVDNFIHHMLCIGLAVLTHIILEELTTQQT